MKHKISKFNKKDRYFKHLLVNKIKKACNNMKHIMEIKIMLYKTIKQLNIINFYKNVLKNFLFKMNNKNSFYNIIIK